MDSKPNFFELVFEICKKIPNGRITTYGSIAKYIGSPQSARMVGWALNKSASQPEFIPAHRVVNRTGLLTGNRHFGGTDIMKELLESEGITILENQIIDFDKHYWDPGKEL